MFIQENPFNYSNKTDTKKKNVQKQTNQKKKKAGLQVGGASKVKSIFFRQLAKRRRIGALNPDENDTAFCPTRLGNIISHFHYHLSKKNIKKKPQEKKKSRPLLSSSLILFFRSQKISLSLSLSVSEKLGQKAKVLEESDRVNDSELPSWSELRRICCARRRPSQSVDRSISGFFFRFLFRFVSSFGILSSQRLMRVS